MENYRLEKKANDITDTVSDLITEIDNLENENKRLQEKINELDETVASLKDEINDLNSELAQS